jgi:hypothetical protein
VTAQPPQLDAKLKHLEFLQAAIARMATNSFIFKGWAITIASALGAFAAANTKSALLAIALISTAMFWGLDGYYLWLERCFITLHDEVARKPSAEIDFCMRIDKTRAARRWISTCLRYHLLVFYGTIVLVEIVGIFFLRGSPNGA